MQRFPLETHTHTHIRVDSHVVINTLRVLRVRHVDLLCVRILKREVLLERVDDLIDPAHASGNSRQQQAVSGALLACTQLKKPETDEEKEKTKIKQPGWCAEGSGGWRPERVRTLATVKQSRRFLLEGTSIMRPYRQGDGEAGRGCVGVWVVATHDKSLVPEWT
jgi:hypothetical protein